VCMGTLSNVDMLCVWGHFPEIYRECVRVCVCVCGARTRVRACVVCVGGSYNIDKQI
jgi:hypothetical protein